MNKSNKRIIHVVSSLNVGGAERFVADLGLLQNKNGADVTVVSFGCLDEVLVSVCEANGLHVIFLTGGVLSRNMQFFDVAKQGDIIHLHTPHALKALLPSLWYINVPKIIYTRHGEMSMNNTMWQWVHKFAKYCVDEVTFVSDKAFEIFQQQQPWGTTPHSVIENGVLTKGIKVNRDNKNKIRLGSVGRMVTLKGQSDLIKAVSMLPQHAIEQVSIEFFGDGEERVNLEKLAKDHPNIEIKFHGMITDRARIYNELDMLVVTSETEGLSLAIIEAMLYEAPVLASNVGGNPKLVKNGETGYLFEYGNVDQLASKIEKLLKDKSKMAILGENGANMIRSRFSLEETMRRYNSVYGI